MEFTPRPDQEAPDFRIDHPTTLVLGHTPLDAPGMFRLAALLDGYELRFDPRFSGHKVKHSFTIDVLEMAPQRTLLRLTPRRKLTYPGLTARVEDLLSFLRTRMNDDTLRVERVEWEVRQMGIPSDERETLRRIK